MRRGGQQPDGQLTFVAMPAPLEKVAAKDVLQWSLRPDVRKYIRIHQSPVTLTRRIWLAPKGYQDLCGWVRKAAPRRRGKVIAIELKRAKLGKLTEDQIENLREVDELGGVTVWGLATLPAIEFEVFRQIGLWRDEEGRIREEPREEDR